MSQLRRFTKTKLIHRVRWFIQCMRLGSLGSSVFIENNVRLMRFPKNIFIKNNVIIKEGSRICSCNEKATIRIGNRTTVGYHTFIFASESIEIGDDCLIAPFVYLVDSNHQMVKGEKINMQPNESAPIRVGDDVWIASNVTVLKGVTIGNGAVIAANSLLNQSVPPFEIWAGTPAKKIGERR